MRAIGKVRLRLPYWPSEGFLVGGAVRDLWLGLTPTDLDFLVPDPQDEAARATGMLGGAVVPLKKGVVRVQAKGLTLDFVPLPAGGLKADLARRDYTVNALAANRTGAVFGVPGAAFDLKKRRLRALSYAALEADPLRSLRGVRLWTNHGFAPEPTTWRWIQRHAAALKFGKKPAWERVFEELRKILQSPRAAFGVEKLFDSGLMGAYLPELANARGVPQGGYHHADVFGHTLEALAYLVRRFPKSPLALRLAVLLHDVAKPLVRAWDEARGYWRFFYHDEDGAALARAILHRLRAGREVEERVAALVRHHMRTPPAEKAALRRWVFRYRGLLPDLLMLQIADRAASRGPRSDPDEVHRLERNLHAANRILKELPERPLLSGREIIALLGIEPGPLVGRASRALLEAQAEGRVRSIEQAKVFVLWWYEAEAKAARRPADA